VKINSSLAMMQHVTTTQQQHQFNRRLSGTSPMSPYQKVKTNLNFTEARDSGWQCHQLGHMQACTRPRQTPVPALHHSIFYRSDALSATQPTASKHWRHLNRDL